MSTAGGLGYGAPRTQRSLATMPPRAARLEGLETTIFTEMTALAQRTGAINLGQGFPDTDGPTEAIDAATNTAGPPITVGSQPFGIAVTPDGKAVYVANFSSGSVTPISTATNTAGTPIVIGATAAIDITITPDGKAAYVTNDTSDSVTPIKIATNTAGTPIAIGTEAGHIAITPDGKTAYVSSFLSSGVVTPINLATNTVGTAISVGSFPLGVAITLDQAPTATFSVVGAPAGEASRFDGSGSSSPVGTVASYR